MGRKKAIMPPETDAMNTKWRASKICGGTQNSTKATNRSIDALCNPQARLSLDICAHMRTKWTSEAHSPDRLAPTGSNKQKEPHSMRGGLRAWPSTKLPQKLGPKL